MSYTKSLSHSFNVDIASKYGIEAALIINHISHWLGVNFRRGVNFIDGCVWMYETHEGMASHFPYLNATQVKYQIQKLVDEGVLIRANHNKNPMNKTTWYTINEKMFTKDNPVPSTDKKVKKMFTKDSPVPSTDNFISCLKDIYSEEEDTVVVVSEPPEKTGGRIVEKFTTQKEEASSSKPGFLPITKINSKGFSVSISQDDLFRRALRHPHWSTQEILYAWNVLEKYEGCVNDCFSFIESVIKNKKLKENFECQKIPAQMSKKVNKNTETDKFLNGQQNKKMNGCFKRSDPDSIKQIFQTLGMKLP